MWKSTITKYQNKHICHQSKQDTNPNFPQKPSVSISFRTSNNYSSVTKANPRSFPLTVISLLLWTCGLFFFLEAKSQWLSESSCISRMNLFPGDAGRGLKLAVWCTPALQSLEKLLHLSPKQTLKKGLHYSLFCSVDLIVSHMQCLIVNSTNIFMHFGGTREGKEVFKLGRFPKSTPQSTCDSW